MSISQVPARLRYQIDRQIGKGSATVYRAQTTDPSLPPTVALKATTVGRALQEARILASVQHPNIPRFYDLVVEDLLAFVVIEYIEGETLSHYLDAYLAQGDLPPAQQVLSMGIQLCAILDYLHTRPLPITFGDVKPQNIMLATDGRLVLIDFDIANTPLEREDSEFPVAGTPGYIAPELLAGVSSFSPLCDVYGLGATLYHLLTGHILPMEIREAAQDPAFERLPRSLRQALLWMTQRDPHQRPADMKMVRVVLEQARLSLRMRTTMWVSRLKGIPLAMQHIVMGEKGHFACSKR